MTSSLASVRRELMMYVAQETDLHQDEAVKMVNIVFSGIRNLLLEEKKVHIRGFGSLYILNRPATPGRNPRTGESLEIAAHKKVSFKASSLLKDALNVKAQNSSSTRLQANKKKPIAKRTTATKSKK